MLLNAQGIKKSYGAVKALRHADLQLVKGEVVALLGDNGAGKSTFVHILSGAITADTGTLAFEDTLINPKKYSVRCARNLGIETVHQDRCLCEGQSLWRNLFVDRHIRTKWGFIDTKAERVATHALLTQWLNHSLDPNAPVQVLSGGERQALAMARAMYFNAKLVILDEPTTALSLKESEKVLQFIDALRNQGRSVLLISHHVHQAYAVADRFVFMQKGRTVGELKKDNTNPSALSEYLLELAE